MPYAIQSITYNKGKKCWEHHWGTSDVVPAKKLKGLRILTECTSHINLSIDAMKIAARGDNSELIYSQETILFFNKDGSFDTDRGAKWDATAASKLKKGA